MGPALLMFAPPGDKTHRHQQQKASWNKYDQVPNPISPRIQMHATDSAIDVQKRSFCGLGGRSLWAT